MKIITVLIISIALFGFVLNGPSKFEERLSNSFEEIKKNEESMSKHSLKENINTLQKNIEITQKLLKETEDEHHKAPEDLKKQTSQSVKAFREKINRLSGIMKNLEEIQKSHSEVAPKVHLKEKRRYHQDTAAPKGGEQKFLDTSFMDENVRTLVGECLYGFYVSLPPAKCYKPGGDSPSFPFCPTGYERHYDFCYRDCEDGYEFLLAECYKKTCSGTYAAVGDSCVNKYFWGATRTPRENYTPEWLSNDSPKLVCTPGMYKFRGLCYRDCGIVNLKNCDIATCSNTSSCREGITDTFLEGYIKLEDSLRVLGNLEITGRSLYTPIKAKENIESYLKDLTDQEVELALNTIRGIQKNDALREAFIERAYNHAISHNKQRYDKKYDNSFIKDICGSMSELFWAKIANSTAISPLDVNIFMEKTLEDAADPCVNSMHVGTSDFEVQCKDKLLSIAAKFDPVPLAVAFASSFKSTCEFPEIVSKLPEISTSPLLIGTHNVTVFHGNFTELKFPD